jgi:hypothetical protein
VVRYGLCTHDGSYTLDYYDEEIDVSHLSTTAEKVEYFEAHIIKKVRCTWFEDAMRELWGSGGGGLFGARVQKSIRSILIIPHVPMFQSNNS